MNANKDSTSGQIEFGVVIISTYTDEITIAFGIPVDEHGTPKKGPPKGGGSFGLIFSNMV